MDWSGTRRVVPTFCLRAWAGAITGLLYMAILVARFVSLMTMHEPKGKPLETQGN